MLGRFSLVTDNGRQVQLLARKGRALIAFLAMHSGEPVGRDKLATLLWGDRSDRHARQSLRQCLVAIRNDLGALAAGLFVSEGDAICLQVSGIDVDALEFYRLARSSDPNDWHQAANLYAGDFLQGLDIDDDQFGEWQRSERASIATLAGDLFRKCAEFAETSGRAADVLAFLDRLVALDPLREDWQRLALQACAVHRGQKAALKRAQYLVDLLKRELSVEPENETRALIEEVRRGNVGDVANSFVASRASGAAPPNLKPRDATPSAPVRGTEVLDTVGRPQSLRWPVAGKAIAATIAVLIVGTILFHPRHDPAIRAAGHEPAGQPSRSVASSWQSPETASQRSGGAPTSKAKAIIPIAVLPFTTYDDAAGSLRMIADTMADDLVNNLSRVPMLRVISRRTMQRYQGVPIDVASIGTELGVQYVLETSLRQHGDKLRVNVELIDPTTRLPTWTTRIERSEVERTDIQDELVRRLARELNFDIYRIASERRRPAPEVELLNYKGFAAVIASSMEGPASLKRAQDYFIQALERDPQNVTARRGLGAYHTLIGAQMLAADSEAHLAKAESLLQQVIAEERDSSSAYFFLGLIYEARSKLDASLEFYQRSLELNPSYVLSYAQSGSVLTAKGRAREGLDNVLYALRLSPRDPHRMHWLRFAGEAELELNGHERAIDYLRQSYDLNPRQPQTLRALAAAYAATGQIDVALKYITDLQQAAPHFSAERLLRRPMQLAASQPEFVRGLQLVLSRLPDTAPSEAAMTK